MDLKMKASEFIKVLQKNIDEYGDLDIYIENLDDTGVYSDINAVKRMNKIYTRKWNPETKKNYVDQKIFLLGEKGYGEFE